MAKIMLVDDEAEIVNLLSVILDLYGYEVAGFTDAAEALAAASRGRPDLALVDLMMPGMDGLTFLNCLDQVPELAGTPVLLLTGLAPTEEPLTQLMKAPGTGFLEKPCDPDRIASEVQRMLDQMAAIPDFRRQVRDARQHAGYCPVGGSDQVA